MTSRQTEIRTFVAATDWAQATTAPLAGDASLRKYLRLGPNPAGTCAVVMDADPALGNDVRPFVQITDHLRSIGLSAPEIFARDTEKGLLLIEDLGDDLFARVVVGQPDLEKDLYVAAADALRHLHDHPHPALDLYDTDLMTRMAALSYDWYLAGALEAKPTAVSAFKTAFSVLLETEVAAPTVLIQRDYHAENLLWLPDRDGIARVGLLDYQDALLGHPAYDLVSLLKDARRDVSPDLEEAILTHFITISGAEPTAFRRAYHVLGLQRNLRILGVFARLSMHFGKPDYVDLIPRVWGYVMRDLGTDVCQPVADLIRRDLPAPTPSLLQRLKDKCGTVPTL